MMIAAYIPKELIGIIGLKTLAKKATDVVLDVTAVALAALLNEYASLLYLSSAISLKQILCLQASTNTKISSAAIPSTMKMTRVCNVP